ncbi:hypothetical protein BV22DRAFT_1029875 [Leucogyrophana mollusca]|uniref:Uncharacterized protein n=1 Tax=Leucogyrophana mollusca TaxID=85980 RepID=A0ACB8BVG9_9AGAM|nr:hypothetical protein BV22DRAFT_1029875 [Leucogyrophana mollusca]
MDFVDFREAWSEVGHGGRVESAHNGRAESAHNGRAGTHDGRAGKENASEGGKIWKLMKRISTGGLRERFQAEKEKEKTPPVPAIPKDFLPGARTPHATADAELGRVMSHPSPSSPPANPQRPRHSSTPRAPSVPSTPRAIPPPHPRPSMATTSSSPGSSEVASTRFFHRSQSARSSVSSYGEEVVRPAVPVQGLSMLDRHIIPRQELLRLAHEDEVMVMKETSRSRSPRRTASGPADLGGDGLDPGPPEESFPPLTPRKAGGSDEAGSDSSCLSVAASPLIPSFSTANPINTFTPNRKEPTRSATAPTEASVFLTPPPPRPARSLLRGNANASKSDSSAPESDCDDTLAERTSHRVSSGAHSNASTAKARPRSNSFNSTSEEAEAHLTFRELDAPRRRPPLSEREKAEIWDDLLERSAQAGGTLHLSGGGGGLMSDRMRFSNYSELS